MKERGNHHQSFTRAHWDRWLKRLNAEIPAEIEEGIQEMRELLQARCVDEMPDNIDEFKRLATARFRSAR